MTTKFTDLTAIAAIDIDDADVLALSDVSASASKKVTVSSMRTAVGSTRGSNANGNYVRFADGTQICWSDDTTLRGPITTAVPNGGFSSDKVTRVFPVAFISTPVVNGSSARVPDDFSTALAATSDVTSTGCKQHLWAAESTGLSAFILSYIAIGRWK